MFAVRWSGCRIDALFLSPLIPYGSRRADPVPPLCSTVKLTWGSEVAGEWDPREWNGRRTKDMRMGQGRGKLGPATAGG